MRGAAVGLLILSTGCFECETVDVHWRALAPGDWIAVDLVFEGVSQAGLGCADVPGCLDAMRRYMATDVAGTPWGPDSWMSVAGASEREVSFRKHGRSLDMVVHLEASSASDLARRWSIVREDHGWRVALPAGAEVDGRGKQGEDGLWSLKGDAAGFRLAVGDEVAPMFETLPALEAALRVPAPVEPPPPESPVAAPPK